MHLLFFALHFSWGLRRRQGRRHRCHPASHRRRGICAPARRKAACRTCNRTSRRLSLRESRRNCIRAWPARQRPPVSFCTRRRQCRMSGSSACSSPSGDDIWGSAAPRQARRRRRSRSCCPQPFPCGRTGRSALSAHEQSRRAQTVQRQCAPPHPFPLWRAFLYR